MLIMVPDVVQTLTDRSSQKYVFTLANVPFLSIQYENTHTKFKKIFYKTLFLLLKDIAEPEFVNF
jgi:hypothetical protein